MSTAPSGVTVRTEKELYATHSGRCSFRGCRKYVFHPAEPADRSANTGKVAHIIGEAPGSARHDPNWTIEQTSDITNLMLMCAEHHDVIDKQVNTYTPDLLREMKAEHEGWLDDLIRRSIEGRRVERTVLLHHDLTTIDEKLALEALVPDYTMVPVQRIELCSPGDDWTGSCVRQDDALKACSGGDWPPNYAVFALSSIPTVANLGRLIGSRCSVRLHQFDRHRDGGTWLWPESPDIGEADAVPAFEGLPTEVTEAAGPVLLRMSLSAEVGLDDCTAVLPGPVAQGHLRVGTPSLEWLRSPDQLVEFGKAYDQALGQIVRVVPNCTGIHVFAAVPCGAAFQIGRLHNPKMHPLLHMYEYSRATTPRYAAALNIG